MKLEEGRALTVCVLLCTGTGMVTVRRAWWAQPRRQRQAGEASLSC